MRLLIFCIFVIFLSSCSTLESKLKEAEKLECRPVDSSGCIGWN